MTNCNQHVQTRAVRQTDKKKKKKRETEGLKATETERKQGETGRGSERQPA